VRREPQRSLVVTGRQVQLTAAHMRISQFGVQAGYHFTGGIDSAAACRIARCLRSGAGFADPVGHGLVLRNPEMLVRRRSERLGGLDG
jgi:hypothetical protein